MAAAFRLAKVKRRKERRGEKRGKEGKRRVLRLWLRLRLLRAGSLFWPFGGLLGSLAVFPLPSSPHPTPLCVRQVSISLPGTQRLVRWLKGNPFSYLWGVNWKIGKLQRLPHIKFSIGFSNSICPGMHNVMLHIVSHSLQGICQSCPFSCWGNTTNWH